MAVRILHLSDLHFNANNIEQDTKFKHLINVLVNENNKQNFNYIFVTGDIINIGKTENFSIALKYFNELIKQLNFNKNNIFMVPGNHDVDFEIEKI